MESTSRKRILFLMSRFLDGGIDTVLVEYLRYLARRDDYELTLAIGISMGPLEVFANRLPHHVRVEWLVKAGWLTRWRQEKVRRHLPLPVKIYDEAVLSPIRRVLISRGLHRLTAIHDFCFPSANYSSEQSLCCNSVIYTGKPRRRNAPCYDSCLRL